VTASVARSATTPSPGLLQKLMGVVRAEFRVDLYVPDPGHPVLGRGICPVTGCDRSPTGNGLCSSHQKRWLERGRPELDAFLTDPGAPLNGRRELTSCTVPGCRYGTSGLGLCMRHRSAWATSGDPDPAVWASTALAADPADRMICRLPFCSLWIDSERNPSARRTRAGGGCRDGRRWRSSSLVVCWPGGTASTSPGCPLSSSSSCSTPFSAGPTRPRSRCRLRSPRGPSARPVKRR